MVNNKFPSINKSCKVIGFKLTDEKLHDIIRRHHALCPFDVIIVDPYSSFSGASDENDNNQNRKSLDKLTELCDELKVSPILIHHKGKTRNDSRGAQAISDWAANIVQLQEQKVKGTRDTIVEFIPTKTRGGMLPESFFIGFDESLIFTLRNENSVIDIQSLIDVMNANNKVIDSKGKLEEQLSEHTGKSRVVVRKIIDFGIKNGIILYEKHGKSKNTQRYKLV